jgi:hypothetical protein
MELTNPTSTSLPSWASELIPDLHDAIWSGGGHHDHAAWCALEVLQRRGLLVQSEPEGLEAAQREAPMAELRAASAEARPAGGLVERVAQGIAAADDEGLTNMTWNHHARAAIREVATWLDTKGQHGCSLWLREEADRG